MRETVIVTQSTQAVVDLLEYELNSISTAFAAPPDVKHDLTGINAREKT